MVWTSVDTCQYTCRRQVSRQVTALVLTRLAGACWHHVSSRTCSRTGLLVEYLAGRCVHTLTTLCVRFLALGLHEVETLPVVPSRGSALARQRARALLRERALSFSPRVLAPSGRRAAANCLDQSADTLSNPKFGPTHCLASSFDRQSRSTPKSRHTVYLHSVYTLPSLRTSPHSVNLRRPMSLWSPDHARAAGHRAVLSCRLLLVHCVSYE